MKIRKEVVPLVAKVRPQQLGIEDVAVSGWLDVSQFDAVQTLAQAGDLDGGEVVLTFEQTKPDAAGDPDTGAKTALAAWTGGTLDADGGTLQVDNDPALLDSATGNKFVRAVLTSDDGASAGPTCSAAMLGLGPRYTDDVAAIVADTPGAGPVEGP
jgi:hypothetical protein